MAGYAGFSKSNNAVWAEECGDFPLSIAKKIVAKKYGVTQKTAHAFLVENGATEWHHSSKFFNEIKYYATELEVEDVEKLKTVKVLNLAVEKDRGKYVIEWIEWEGSRKRPKAVVCTFTGRAEIKGDWIYFEGKRKKISGNHLKYTKKSTKKRG